MSSSVACGKRCFSAIKFASLNMTFLRVSSKFLYAVLITFMSFVRHFVVVIGLPALTGSLPNPLLEPLPGTAGVAICDAGATASVLAIWTIGRRFPKASLP